MTSYQARTVSGLKYLALISSIVFALFGANVSSAQANSNSIAAAQHSASGVSMGSATVDNTYLAGDDKSCGSGSFDMPCMKNYCGHGTATAINILHGDVVYRFYKKFLYRTYGQNTYRYWWTISPTSHHNDEHVKGQDCSS
jgi:hypothetical protein